MSTQQKSSRSDQAKLTREKKAIVAKSLKSKAKTTTKVVDLSLKSERVKAKKSPSVKAQVQKETLAYLTSPSAASLKPFKRAALELKKKRKEQAKKSREKQQLFLAKSPRKGRKYSLDLRINSFNTSGYFKRGGIEPGPALSRLSRAKGLDLICLTNYYSASHLDVINQMDPKSKVNCLPGLDLTCKVGFCEEVHFIAIFSEDTTKEVLEKLLNDLDVPESVRGKPGHILNCSCAEMIKIVEAAGGVLVPTEIDKTPSQELAIPYLVEEFGFHFFDLVSPENPEVFMAWPEGEFTFFSFSNALSLAQIGGKENIAKLEIAGFEGIKKRAARRV